MRDRLEEFSEERKQSNDDNSMDRDTARRETSGASPLMNFPIFGRDDGGVWARPEIVWEVCVSLFLGVFKALASGDWGQEKGREAWVGWLGGL